jgi:hypothetical protein
MRAKLVVAWAISIAVAVALARGATGTAPASRPAGAPREAVFPGPSSAPAPIVARSTLTIDDLRRAVREELAAQAATTTPSAPEVPDEARVEAEARSAEVRDRALVTVNAAIDAGRWTGSDRDTLRPQLEQLTHEDIKQVLGRLLPAVNDGKVRIETDGLLF